MVGLNWINIVKFIKRKFFRMKTSQAGIDLIKHFEGFRARAYKCPAGVLTIGYGHTRDVKEVDVITQEQAEKLLRDDLKGFERCIEDKFGKDWEQYEYDALVSFAYNLGCNGFGTGLSKALRNKDTENINKYWLMYNKAGGRVLNGLVRRRKAELELFKGTHNKW